MNIDLNKNTLPTLFVALIALSISTYQTAIGFSQAFDFPGMGLAFSCMITAMLGYINWILLNKEGGLHTKDYSSTFLIYLSFAFFSITANFNSLYSNYMKPLWISEDLALIEAEINQLEGKVITLVDKKYNISGKEKELNQLKESLKYEIYNPGNKGFGKEAKSFVKSIEKILGTKISIPKGSPNEIFRALNRQIEDAFDVGIVTQTSLINEVIDSLKSYTPIIKNRIREVRLTSSVEDDKDIIYESYLFCNKQNYRISEIISDTSIYKYKELKNKIDEIGRIQHSYKMMKDSNNKSIALVLILLCILLDFGTPIAVIWAKNITQYD